MRKERERERERNFKEDIPKLSFAFRFIEKLSFSIIVLSRTQALLFL